MYLSLWQTRDNSVATRGKENKLVQTLIIRRMKRRKTNILSLAICTPTEDAGRSLRLLKGLFTWRAFNYKDHQTRAERVPPKLLTARKTRGGRQVLCL